jgi:hypothetical protein
MRTRPALLAVAVLLALAGCVPSESQPTAAPSASATPVFASDADALAAAEKAYAAYLKVSDELAHGGWHDLGLLEGRVRGTALSNDKKSAASFASSGLVQRGETTFDSTRLESVDEHGDGRVGVTVYLCVDVSAVDVVSADGTSVVPATRRERVPLEVDIDNLESSGLEVSRNDIWSGSDFC